MQPNVQLNVHPDVRTREATHARVDHQNTSRIKQSRSRDSDSDEDNIPLAVLAKKLRADDDPSTSDDHIHARYPPMMVRPQKRERDTSPEDTTSKRFAREGTSHAKISTTPMEVSAIGLSDNHGCEGVAESHSMDVPELTAGASEDIDRAMAAQDIDRAMAAQDIDRAMAAQDIDRAMAAQENDRAMAAQENDRAMAAQENDGAKLAQSYQESSLENILKVCSNLTIGQVAGMLNYRFLKKKSC